MPSLFIDNGGSMLRAVYSSDDRGGARSNIVTITAPNVLGIVPSDVMGGGNIGGASSMQVYGNALLSLPHFHQLVLRRPTDKGFIVDAKLQALLWSQCLFEPLGIVSEKDIDLILTCPVGCPHDAAAVIETLVFEIFKFKSLTLVTTAMLSIVGCEIDKRTTVARARAETSESSDAAAPHIGQKRSERDCLSEEADMLSSPPPLTGIVVDSGFSGTTVAPFLGGRPVVWNTVRLDVGGKVMTNHLKEMVSFSQVNLTEDTWLCNAIKEACCFCHYTKAAESGANTASSSASTKHHAAPSQYRRLSDYPTPHTLSATPVLDHSSTTRSVVDALSIYQRWQRLSPLEKRRAVADQRRLVKAMLKQVKQMEKREEKQQSRRAGAKGEISAETATVANDTAVASAPIDREAAATAMAAASVQYWFPPPAISYVLPSTPQTQPLGHVVTPQQLAEQGNNDDFQYVRLGHECFIVGEALFFPQLIGLKQIGVAEIIRNGLWYDPRRAGTPLFGAPPSLRQTLMRNIVVTGGTGTQMKGFTQRLSSEIRPCLFSNDGVDENENFIRVCSDLFAVSGATAMATTQPQKRLRTENGKVTSNNGPIVPSPSFLSLGVMALFFGQHEDVMKAILLELQLAAPSHASTASTLFNVAAALLDPKCTVLGSSLTRDSMREAVSLVR